MRFFMWRRFLPSSILPSSHLFADWELHSIPSFQHQPSISFFCFQPSSCSPLIYKFDQSLAGPLVHPSIHPSSCSSAAAFFPHSHHTAPSSSCVPPSYIIRQSICQCFPTLGLWRTVRRFVPLGSGPGLRWRRRRWPRSGTWWGGWCSASAGSGTGWSACAAAGSCSRSPRWRSPAGSPPPARLGKRSVQRYSDSTGAFWFIWI